MSLSFFTDSPAQGDETPPRKIDAGVREEEVCRILNLKNHLDYSDVLIKYTAKYLSLGWQLVAVTSRGQADLGLDFRQPESQWSQRMMELGLEGVQVNLGVRTGTASRLLVLEVHRQSSLFPFSQPGDWCSPCVAEIGREREQHYYEIPAGWRPPASFFLNAFQIMVFGEGGMVLAPPSVEPEAKANLRWLRPPWQTPPAPPAPILRKFLQTTSPPAESDSPLKPDLPAWEELYPLIVRRPKIMQALLAPAIGAAYYEKLLDAALAAGLKDQRLLLALLWYAPQGDLRQQPEGLAVLQNLLARRMPQEDPEWWWKAPEEKVAPVGKESPLTGEKDKTGPTPASPEAPPTAGAKPGSPWRAPLAGALDLKDAQGQMREWFSQLRQTWQEVLQFSQENFLVERRKYEAMIYELGRLGTWQEICRQKHRENQLLKEQLDAQHHRELNYLRRLLKQNR